LSLLLALLLLPSLSRGQTFDNVGFMKNVPPELRQKFPVCDEFLEVKWIDPKQHIGRMRVTEYQNGKPYSPTDVIVTLEQWPPRQNGSAFAAYVGDALRDKTFDAFVRGARISYAAGDFSMIIRKGRRKEELTRGLSVGHEWSRDLPPHLLDAEGAAIVEFSIVSLAGKTKNVCLIEPEGDAAVIVEDKEPFFYGMPDEASKQRYAAILNAAQGRCEEVVQKEGRYVCDMSRLEFGTSIDINGDGKEDYVSRFDLLNPDRTGTDMLFALISGTSGFVYIPDDCRVWLGEHPFSYNAKERSLYYGPCNLTQLSKGVK
jgi:hypothetical protein